MARSILKYRVGFDLGGFAEHDIPRGARVIMVGENPREPGVLYLWAECDMTQPMQRRAFQIFGTGQPIPAGLEHAGSAITSSGFVWHVYEVPDPTRPF